MTTESVNNPPPEHVKVLGGQGWIGLIDHMGSEVSIVNAARVSFGKRKAEMDDKDVKLVDYLIKHKHTSTLEHVMFTFIVHCPLFVRSQWHRHRTWSYNEISRRYTELDLEFYVPVELREQAVNDRQASVGSKTIDQEACNELMVWSHNKSLAAFNWLLDRGVCREQARGVLPQNLMTTFWATVDLSNLLHFLDLRDSDHAQSEIREYAKAIRTLIAPYVPHVIKEITQ